MVDQSFDVVAAQYQKDFELRRAVTAFTAYMETLPTETKELISRHYADALTWEAQPVVVQEAWIAAANAAAEYH